MSALSQSEAQAYILTLQSRVLQVGLFLDQSTEVSGGGYARSPLTLANSSTVAGVGKRTSNLNDLSFGPATDDWAAPPNAVTWVKVFDASTGNVVWGGSLPEATQLSVISGQPYEIKAGSLGLLIRTFDS